MIKNEAGAQPARDVLNPGAGSWAKFRNRAFDSRRKHLNLIGKQLSRFADLKDQTILARCDAEFLPLFGLLIGSNETGGRPQVRLIR